MGFVIKNEKKVEYLISFVLEGTILDGTDNKIYQNEVIVTVEADATVEQVKEALAKEMNDQYGEGKWTSTYCFGVITE